jgi:hypothetical protein
MSGFENLKNIEDNASLNNDTLSSLGDELKTISAPKVNQVQTREVILTMMSSCGCGELPVQIKRKVPHDSTMNTGDTITKDELLPTDELV